MIDQDFTQELGRLRALAAEFAGEHPALAPMLLGQGADPDVERLFEGVAFLTALLRQRLDDSFPEFLHDLAGLLFPQYLLSIPAVAMVRMRPLIDDGLPLRVQSGCELLSVPVDGTACRFRTCHELFVPPLRQAGCALLEPADRTPTIRLQFRLSSPEGLAALPELRLHVHGGHAEACDLLLLLTRHLRRLLLHWSGPSAAACGRCVLEAGAVRLAGFDRPLLPCPERACDCGRVLHEYFAQPASLLFVAVESLPALPPGVRELSLDFELDRAWPWMPEVRDDNLAAAQRAALQSAQQMQLQQMAEQQLLLARAQQLREDLLQAQQARTQALQERVELTLQTLPTDINPEAAARPFAVALRVDCDSGGLQLHNLNLPRQGRLAWSPARCGGAQLRVWLGELLLRRDYPGRLGLADLLADFASGSRDFAPADFPAQAEGLRRLGVRRITVRLRVDGADAARKLAARLRASEQQRIAARDQLRALRQRQQQAPPATGSSAHLPEAASPGLPAHAVVCVTPPGSPQDAEARAVAARAGQPG